MAQTIGYYGYIFTFPLGFIGNVCSLLTFSSTTLRCTSTGLFFLCLTISDILYQLVSIYDFLEQILQVSIIRNQYLCRFRTFIFNFSTVTSAWLLVFISIDRLVCTNSLNYRLQRPRRKKVICSTIVLCLCSIVFTSHVLQTEFAFILPTGNMCGPARFPLTSYSGFYYQIWPILKLLITYLTPNCLMVICVFCIYAKLRLQRRLITISIRTEKLQQQMLIMMISSIVFFSICTLPYSIYLIIFWRGENQSAMLIEIAILTNFLNINYSYNFYIHCLTSRLFREKFIKRLKKLFPCRKRQRRIILSTCDNK